MGWSEGLEFGGQTAFQQRHLQEFGRVRGGRFLHGTFDAYGAPPRLSTGGRSRRLGQAFGRSPCDGIHSLTAVLPPSVSQSTGGYLAHGSQASQA